jgi:hypothetical protein
MTDHWSCANPQADRISDPQRLEAAEVFDWPRKAAKVLAVRMESVCVQATKCRIVMSSIMRRADASSFIGAPV